MVCKRLTFLGHLEEVRIRLIKILIGFIILSCVSYQFVPAILSLLRKHIGQLVFITPTEAFMAHFYIALWGGLFLSSPLILFQIWRFVFSGLKVKERKIVLVFGSVSFILFIAGCMFGYFVIVPVSLKFFLGFAGDFIVPMITVSKYISFVGTVIVIFGAAFELPLIMMFLVKIGLLKHEVLSQRRREAIVAIFVAAAFLTPPDVVSQIFLAVPLLVLYEIGIVFSKCLRK